MRIVAYGGVSTLSATFAVLAAFRQRANFYAAAVYLSKSNACMMILCNFGIFCTIILAKILQSIFFGQLRSVEIERLNDRLWFTISETLLALAVFRDEFDTSFVVLFISLVFVKCFHWLAADRVDWMDQAPTPPGKLFHARMISILSIIWTTDMILIAYATESILLHGPSVVLMFEMEYIIMQVTCLSIICKYMLNSYAHYRAQEHWEGKSTYQFYIDLGTDFLKLITYIGFLSLTLSFHALPLNVLRDVYYTFRSFVTKCNNLIRFRQATRNMNERYPNATREEMEVLADKTCIICREEMEFREDPQVANPAQNNNLNSNANATVGPNDTPKKLSCGHIFHFHCLRSWLERQQTCPTCRRPVIQSPTPPQAAPQIPNAAANRAFAAAMAAAGVGPPPIPPAPPAHNRGGAPAAQPPLPPQAAAADGNLFGTRPDGTRPDFQQRLREFQQRMTAAPFGPNGAAPNATLDSGSQNTPNALRMTGANPLVSFDLSGLSGTTGGSSTLHPPESSNLQQAGSNSSSTGLSITPSVTANINKKDTLSGQSRNSLQRQTGTNQDAASKSAQPARSPELSDPQIASRKDANTSITLQNTASGETKNPLQNFNSSNDASELKGLGLTDEVLTKSSDSKSLESSLVDGPIDCSADKQFDITAQKLRKEGLIRFPCLIPLFDHKDEILTTRSTSPSSLATSLNNQIVVEQYSKKIKQLETLKIISRTTNESGELDPTSDEDVLIGKKQVDQLMEIQNSLIDCCSKLASFIQLDSIPPSSLLKNKLVHENLKKVDLNSVDHDDEKTKEQNQINQIPLSPNHDTDPKGKNREIET